MVTRHSVLALALLFVLSAISGCKRQVDIELSRYHTPVIYVYEGQVLKLHPPKDSVLTLTFDKPGLCNETGLLRGTADQPAQSTIAKQTFHDNEPNIYYLTVSGSDGVTYPVQVKPCTGFCKLSKPCTGFCQ